MEMPIKGRKTGNQPVIGKKRSSLDQAGTALCALLAVLADRMRFVPKASSAPIKAARAAVRPAVSPLS
jgi:hypothetical protein